MSIGVEDAAAVRALRGVTTDVKRHFSTVRAWLTVADPITCAPQRRHVAHLVTPGNIG
jgi:hypothetical protein